jgi:protein-S-isoprenylcysteine O-methyltransferase Ste14
MEKRGFWARHHIVRNAIKKDLLYFAIPALLVFSTGLGVAGFDGWSGFWFPLWKLLTQPSSISTHSVINIIGLAIILIGLIVIFIAVGTLRWSYSSTLVIREDHRLVTYGIYSIVRHPLYLGALLVSIGVPISASSWLGLLIMLVLVPIVINRIRMEERLLTEAFGDAYRKYIKTTRKLIPLIY